MSGHTGVAAMVRLALHLEEQHGAETLNIGRSAAVIDDCVLESASRRLSYQVTLVGDEVRLSVSLMDSTDQPQTLLRTRDDPAGWDMVERLVGALEKAEIKSLQRPIEAGTPGDPDRFVIG
jgi:hypothetical protein